MQSRSCCGSIRNDDGRTSYYASVLNRSNVHQTLNHTRTNGRSAVTAAAVPPLHFAVPKTEAQTDVVSVVVVDADDPSIQIERINSWAM